MTKRTTIVVIGSLRLKGTWHALQMFPHFYTHHTIVAGYYGITLVVPHVSVRPSVVCLYFRLPDDNLSKFRWIFTKLGMRIDIVEIWFGIAYGQISSIFDRIICPRHDNGWILSFHVFIYKDATLFTSCLLSCTPNPFMKGVHFRRREFAPIGSEFALSF